MESTSYEIASDGENDQNEIRIEIQQDDDMSHNQIHTIQLQSPGGSSHFVEGLVVTTTSQQFSNSDTHMTLTNGNTIILENSDGETIHHNGMITMREKDDDGENEQILCGPGIRVVGLATDENGDTILLVPKQESSPVMVLGPSSSGLNNFKSGSLCLKETPQLVTVHQAQTSTSSAPVTTAPKMSGQPTLVVVSSSSNNDLNQTSMPDKLDHDSIERPKRKAALKAIATRKAAKRKREKYAAAIKPGSSSPNISNVTSGIPLPTDTSKLEQIIGEVASGAGKENADPTNEGLSTPMDTDTAPYILPHASHIEDNLESSDDEEIPSRRCVVCLRRRRFTEDIFDSSKQLYYHIDVLISHLNIQIKGTPANTGLCPECMNNLQRWHIFNCAIVKRHEQAKSTGAKVIDEPMGYQAFESRVYKNYKKLDKVKEVYCSATHGQYTRRHLNEKDWDFFCDHLFHSNSVKSEKSRELEKFMTCREKLSHIYCTTCQKLISNGKKGYARHMRTMHQQSPVMYPCDICGSVFPEKDMTASTEDYYPHWISHFYFNKCDDCKKRFPTKRALGQHRHAVHKNRTVKCDKCGKVLANRMSLDLHLLRHLPDNEKKKYMIKCKICKKKIAQWNLKSHVATHNDERPWKCDHCDATFKMKGALVSHRDVVHFNLKNHVCNKCGDAFKSASSLRGHVRRHEGRKDYKCEVCLKEYYTYSALKGHKVVHQTARDFICPTCGKAFKKKKALEEHITIHTGEKPHSCPICGREIRVKSNLYKHMKIHKKNPADARGPTPSRKKGSKSSTSKIKNGTISTVQVQSTEMDHSSVIRTASATQDENGTLTVTLDGGGSVVGDHLGTPIVVSIVTTGCEGLDSPSSIVEIRDAQPQIINAVQLRSSQHEGTPVSISHSGTTTFLTPAHFQGAVTSQSNLVQTLTMQHQHQDLLNVPIQNGHYYTTTPQYFSSLD